MPRINFTVNLRVGRNTQPLKRAYVEHIAFGLRVPGSQLYITDDSGRVRDPQGNLGIDAIPNLLNGRIDVRIICHNSVVKIPNGILDHFNDFSIADGGTITITNANSQNNFNHFRILNRCIEVYDNVLRQFQVFSSEFPLGKKNTLDNTRKSRQRLEVSFPSSIVVQLAFVEPKSIHTGFPVIHIGNIDGRFPIDDPSNRLFGNNPMLIPAELSHALHFSHLNENQRHDITVKYGKFIVTDFLLGGGGTHSMLKDTDPLVAFVEAFDHFVHRFDRFIRANPNLTGVPLRNGFIRAELDSREQFDRNTRGFGTMSGNLSTGIFTPNPAFLTRGRNSATSIEGSIYGAIFLDFARRPGVGLRTAVNAYIRSKALSFGEFRTWVRRNLPNLRTQLDDVVSTWTL